MRIEHKALAHIERAHELLQNDLAFGVSDLHEQFNLKGLPKDIWTKILENLDMKSLRPLSETDRTLWKETQHLLLKSTEELPPELSIFYLRRAWYESKEEIMDNEHVVLKAMQNNIMALKYASDRIQKNKELARFACNKNCDALIAYAKQVTCLENVSESLITQYNNGDITLEVLHQNMNKMFMVHLPDHTLPEITKEDLSSSFRKRFSHHFKLKTIIQRDFEKKIIEYNAKHISLEDIRDYMNFMITDNLSRKKRRGFPEITDGDLTGSFQKKFSNICRLERDTRLKHAMERTYEIKYGIFPAAPADAEVFKEVCKSLWDADHEDGFWFLEGELYKLNELKKGDSLFTSKGFNWSEDECKLLGITTG